MMTNDRLGPRWLAENRMTGTEETGVGADDERKVRRMRRGLTTRRRLTVNMTWVVCKYDGTELRHAISVNWGGLADGSRGLKRRWDWRLDCEAGVRGSVTGSMSGASYSTMCWEKLSFSVYPSSRKLLARRIVSTASSVVTNWIKPMDAFAELREPVEDTLRGRGETTRNKWDVRVLYDRCSVKL